MLCIYSKPSGTESVTLFTFRHSINFPLLMKSSHMRSNFPSVFPVCKHSYSSQHSLSFSTRLHNTQLISVNCLHCSHRAPPYSQYITQHVHCDTTLTKCINCFLYSCSGDCFHWPLPAYV